MKNKMLKIDLILIFLGLLFIFGTFFNEYLIYPAIFVNLSALFRNLLKNRDNINEITNHIIVPAVLSEIIYFILFNPTYFYFFASRIFLINVFFLVFKLAAPYFERKYRALPFLITILYINIGMALYFLCLFGLSFSVFTEDMYIYALGVPVFISMIIVPIILIIQVLHISIVLNKKIFLMYLLSFMSMLIFPFSLVFIPFVSVVLAIQAIVGKREKFLEES